MLSIWRRTSQNALTGRSPALLWVAYWHKPSGSRRLAMEVAAELAGAVNEVNVGEAACSQRRAHRLVEVALAERSKPGNDRVVEHRRPLSFGPSAPEPQANGAASRRAARLTQQHQRLSERASVSETRPLRAKRA